MQSDIALIDEVIALLEASSAKQRAMQRRLAKTLKRQQKTAERRFTGVMVDVLDELGKRAEQAFLDHDSLYKPDEIAQEAAEDGQLVAAIMAALKISEFQAKVLLPKYQSEYLAILKDTYDTVATSLQVGLNLPDPVMRNILAEGGKRVGLLDLDAGTRTKLFELLEQGRSQGMGSDALARLIRDEIPAGPWSTSKMRAEVIARAETKYAQNKSAMESYRNSPAVTGLQAMDNLIGFNDEDCMARDGKVFTFEEAEAEQEKEHPNGTLTWVPYTGEL